MSFSFTCIYSQSLALCAIWLQGGIWLYTMTPPQLHNVNSIWEGFTNLWNWTEINFCYFWNLAKYSSAQIYPLSLWLTNRTAALTYHEANKVDIHTLVGSKIIVCIKNTYHRWKYSVLPPPFSNTVGGAVVLSVHEVVLLLWQLQWICDVDFHSRIPQSLCCTN